MIDIVLTLIVCGVLLWLVTLIPMDATILKIIRVVVIISVVLWLLGFLTGGYHVPVWSGGWRH